jgi:hypothetical protein
MLFTNVDFFNAKETIFCAAITHHSSIVFTNNGKSDRLTGNSFKELNQTPKKVD